MNTIITNSAQNYAQALFEIGLNFEKDLAYVLNTIDSSADFTNIISNPAIDLNTKDEILNEIFQNKIDEKVLQFIKILTEKKRINELAKIYEAYNKKIQEHNNIIVIEITSAIELDEETKTQIVNKWTKKTKKTIIPQWNINKDIISGLVFKINDNIIDTSLLNKIESIGKNIR